MRAVVAGAGRGPGHRSQWADERQGEVVNVKKPSEVVMW